MGSCENSTIKCNGKCNIFCMGANSCKNAEILIIGENSEISVLMCYLSGSCENSRVDVTDGMVAMWSCMAEGSCDYAQMWCWG